MMSSMVAPQLQRYYIISVKSCKLSTWLLQEQFKILFPEKYGILLQNFFRKF